VKYIKTLMSALSAEDAGRARTKMGACRVACGCGPSLLRHIKRGNGGIWQKS